MSEFKDSIQWAALVFKEDHKIMRKLEEIEKNTHWFEEVNEQVAESMELVLRVASLMELVGAIQKWYYLPI